MTAREGKDTKRGREVRKAEWRGGGRWVVGTNSKPELGSLLRNVCVDFPRK